MDLFSHLPPRVLPLAVEEAVHALHVVNRVRAWTAEDEVTFLEVRIVQGSLDSHDEVVIRTTMEDIVARVHDELIAVVAHVVSAGTTD
jgi:hypothetical protein